MWIRCGIERNASVFAVLLALAGCDNSCVTGAIPADTFTKEQQAERKVAIPWASHAKTCRVAGLYRDGTIRWRVG